MKNIITVAALLAAGAALANADAEKIAFDNTVAEIALNNFTGSADTIVATFDVDNLKNYLIRGASKETHQLLLLKPADTDSDSKIGVTTNFSSNGTNYVYTSGLYGITHNASNYEIGMSTGTLGSESTDFWSGVTGAVIALSTISSGDNPGTIIGLSLLKNGSVVDYGYTLIGGFKYSNATWDTLAIDTNSVISGYVENTRYSAEDLKSLAAASLIPEPSAFGLLAGLGALALVAARRRRQKKA